MNSASKNGRRRYSPEEWEAQKVNVERLYITENRPLKEVIHVLSQDFGFTASEKQLKSRLPEWGFDVKNIKGDTMIELARKRAKRHEVENKRSSFRVSKKPVDERKIDRYLQRKDISQEELLSMASPVNVPSPSFSVFTPHSIRSPTPGLDLTARSPRSPTPGLDFQTLSIIDPQPPSLSDPLPTTAKQVEIADSGILDSLSSRSLQTSAENVAVDGNMQETPPPSMLPRIAEEVTIITAEFQGQQIYSKQPAEAVASIIGDLHRPSPYVGWPMPTAAGEVAERPEKSQRWRRIWNWPLTCHYCFERGMTIPMEPCPDCGHPRCSMCLVEALRWH